MVMDTPVDLTKFRESRQYRAMLLSPVHFAEAQWALKVLGGFRGEVNTLMFYQSFQ